jgi:hypothetical protein
MLFQPWSGEGEFLLESGGWWMAVQQSVVPAIGRSRRRTKPSVVSERRAPAQPPLRPALEGLFVLVSEPVLKLETSPDAHLTLREISILLGDVLDLLVEEQIILQAADELYEAAFAFQDARERRSTCVNITTRIVATRTEALHAALAGFRTSLWSARPNARGRARRLAW